MDKPKKSDKTTPKDLVVKDASVVKGGITVTKTVDKESTSL